MLLPLVVFVIWQFVLIASTSGTGSWAGMTIFFSSLVTVPVLAVLNLWVLVPRWRGHFRAFVAGLGLPAAFGALELLMLHGPTKQKDLLGAAIDSPLAPLVAILFCVPLIAAVVHAILRRRAGARPSSAPSGSAAE